MYDWLIKRGTLRVSNAGGLTVRVVTTPTAGYPSLDISSTDEVFGQDTDHCNPMREQLVVLRSLRRLSEVLGMIDLAQYYTQSAAIAEREMSATVQDVNAGEVHARIVKVDDYL